MIREFLIALRGKPKRKALEMDDRKRIQKYVNDFRRHFARYLRPSIGLKTMVYPALGGGGVIEFTLGPEVANADAVMPQSATVNDALKLVQQHAFGGELEGFRFGGTNVLMEPNRIILIKGDDAPASWSDDAAEQDVTRIVTSPKKR